MSRFLGSDLEYKKAIIARFSCVLPRGYNSSDFTSLRWKKRANANIAKLNKWRKATVDVSRVGFSSLAPSLSGGGDPDIPVKEHCEKNVYIQSPDAPFVVHHYVGTYEEFSSCQSLSAL